MTNTYNDYGREMPDAAIAAGEHRAWVGGLWEQMGQLQLDFLRQQGLRPEHSLLDVGCGALRGGVRFVEYLEARRYAGMDLNESLIRAGRYELALAGLNDREAQLVVDTEFNFSLLGMQFDYAIAQSVFSHLPVNHICQCLTNMARVLRPGGRFFATFFEAPAPVHLQPITHHPSGIITRYDRDPFHYAVTEFEWMAAVSGMRAHYIGDWSHPRGQRMLAFTPQ